MAKLTVVINLQTRDACKTIKYSLKTVRNAPIPQIYDCRDFTCMISY